MQGEEGQGELLISPVLSTTANKALSAMSSGHTVALASGSAGHVMAMEPN